MIKALIERVIIFLLQVFINGFWSQLVAPLRHSLHPFKHNSLGFSNSGEVLFICGRRLSKQNSFFFSFLFFNITTYIVLTGVPSGVVRDVRLGSLGMTTME